ncbi:hypothetical protein BLNAU_179 [Blattamonas nauphoetae]|uniref:Uncharacterized protein n=1 Tax=Blattamonas nauphoetae TaxID=2049346 RepID=A0ABQ9YM90_9EUKA|nr:hypothetical protein BLNAU_179 [Blattamonas nauphoetae]
MLSSHPALLFSTQQLPPTSHRSRTYSSLLPQVSQSRTSSTTMHSSIRRHQPLLWPSRQPKLSPPSQTHNSQTSHSEHRVFSRSPTAPTSNSHSLTSNKSREAQMGLSSHVNASEMPLNS